MEKEVKARAWDKLTKILFGYCTGKHRSELGCKVANEILTELNSLLKEAREEVESGQ
jgi:hypothetical protein